MPRGRWRSQMRYDKLLGGHTAMVPTTPRNIRGRFMILTLGGPLASATLGAIGALRLLLIPGPAWPAALGRTVALATGFALGDFLFNLLPMASEAQYSDGALLWQMVRRGPWCDFHCANHYMALSRTTPLRPRDWPTAMVERAAEFAAQLPDSAGSFAMAYLHFLDRGDWQRALLWLEKAHRQRARQAGWLTHSSRSRLSARHSIVAIAGKRSAGSRRLLSGTIRPITGAPLPLSGRPKATWRASAEAWDKALGLPGSVRLPGCMTWTGNSFDWSAHGWRRAAAPAAVGVQNPEFRIQNEVLNLLFSVGFGFSFLAYS